MDKCDYFLGVDSGGTKTIAVIASGSGEIIGRGKAGSADILNLPRKTALKNLELAVGSAFKEAQIEKNDITFSCFGMPAFGDVIGMEGEIIKLVEKVIAENKLVVNDVRLALEASHPMKKGIVLLNGTGAMAMAKDDNDNVIRIDGWGEHAGDMGSGYYIGKRSLQAAFKNYDGRISEGTILIEEVKKQTGVNDIRELLQNCKGDRSRSYIASFSRAACSAADAGDPVALGILDDAVEELIITLNAISKRIVDTPIPVATAGGTFSCTYLRNKFLGYLRKAKEFEIKESFLPPFAGAIILASKKTYTPLQMEEFIKLLEFNL